MFRFRDAMVTLALQGMLFFGALSADHLSAQSVSSAPPLPRLVQPRGVSPDPKGGSTGFLTAASKPPNRSTVAVPSQPADSDARNPDLRTMPKSLADSAVGFIENRGQFDARVKYQLRTGSRTLWLTGTSLVFDSWHVENAEETSARKLAVAGTVAPVHRILSRQNAPSFGPDAKPPVQIQREVLSEDFPTGNPDPVIEPGPAQAGIYNYFVGNNPEKWRTHVRTFEYLLYRNLWPGIDLKLYPKESGLEQDFIVHPHADPRRIRVSYRGINELQIDADGALIVGATNVEMRESPPLLYQEEGGRRVPVKASFRILGANTYGFEIANFDGDLTLVVDPTLLYSTYLGGSSGQKGSNGGGDHGESGQGIAVDSSGNAYITGSTPSPDFPVTPGAFQTSVNSLYYSAFVTKLAPLGDHLIYSTFLSGTSQYSQGKALAIDSAGEAYIMGEAGPGFPTTPNAFQPTTQTDSEFFTKLTASGDALIYSTFLGPGFQLYGHGIAVDSSGRAYIAGSTVPGFPSTPNAFQTVIPNGGLAAFLSVIDPSSSGTASLLYSTTLGVTNVSSVSVAYGVAVDAFGMAYITGYAGDTLPTTSGAFQTLSHAQNCDDISYHSCDSAFVAKFNPNASGASSLIYSTYIGGSSGQDFGNGIAVDSLGNTYLTGSTSSSDFPITPGAYQASLGCEAAFVTKLNAAGNNLVYSTFLNGPNVDGYCLAYGNAIALDSANDATVVGLTNNLHFPTTPNAFQPALRGRNDVFLTRFDPTGSQLVYSSYLGGSSDDSASGVAVDLAGDAYVTGYTDSVDFPITFNAFQPTMIGEDAFITKFPLGAPGGLSITGIDPDSGGNAGTIRPQVVGAGFHLGATVTLTGPTQITGTSSLVGLEGQTINTTFDLTKALPGAYNVVVTNPDGTSTTISQAYTIVQGGTTQLSVQLTGSPAFRQNDESPFQVIIRNSGTVDAHDVLLALTLPPTVQYTLACPMPSASDIGLPWSTPPDWCQLPMGFTDATGNTEIPIWLLTLGAGSNMVLPVSIAAAQGLVPHSFVNVLSARLWSAPTSVFSTTGDINQLPASPTAQAIASAFVEAVGPSGARQLAGSEQRPSLTNQQALQWITDLGIRYAKWADANETIPITLDFSARAIGAAVGAWWGGMRGEAAANGYDIGEAITTFNQAFILFGRAAYWITQYNNGLNQALASIDSEYIAAGDPNAIGGPRGVAPASWLSGTQPLAYSIFFANEPTASAPAQTVIVTDPLDPNVDISSLVLTNISIPGIQVPIPPTFSPQAGIYSVMTNVDLRPAQSMFVNISVSLNPSTRLVTWTFTSIDPTTGLPPTDPRVGFLPPGTGGSVSFMVMPKQGLITGTQVSSQGSVVFDAPPPTNTKTWTNTLDNAPPTSQVTALPAHSCVDLKVRWSGADVGSGIQDYAVYVSDTGAPFTAWLTNNPATSATYQGQAGHTYGFYSIARDRTGNMEPGKTVAEATTTVGTNVSCGGPPSLIGRATVQSLSGTTLTIALQVTNNGTMPANNVVLNKVAPKVLSGTGKVSFISPTLPITVGTLAPGASATVNLVLNVAKTVTNLAITESGTMQDSQAKTYNFTLGQEVVP